MFLNELLASLKLSRIEWIDFGNVGGECQLEVNGVIIMAMWWQFDMGMFGEYIREVGTPVGYGHFCGNILLGNLSGDGDLVN